MRDLSVRGVYRRYTVEPLIEFFGSDDPALVGDPKKFSVRTAILGPAGGSLRSALEALARTYVGPAEVFHNVCDDIVGNLAYTQTWTHIDVRIQLIPDGTVSSAALAAAQSTWQAGIEGIWNSPLHDTANPAAPWKCSKPGEVACRVSFKVHWVLSGADHVVAVHPPAGRADEENWYADDSAWVAAHEFGHMLGLLDEYDEPDKCPGRSPTNTGTIMAMTGSTLIPQRLVQAIANEIRSDLQ